VSVSVCSCACVRADLGFLSLFCSLSALILYELFHTSRLGSFLFLSRFSFAFLGLFGKKEKEKKIIIYLCFWLIRVCEALNFGALSFPADLVKLGFLSWFFLVICRVLHQFWSKSSSFGFNLSIFLPRSQLRAQSGALSLSFQSLL
jgi:hypothetical protein